MFQKCSFAILLALTISCVPFQLVQAQDAQENSETIQQDPANIELKPNVVVQPQMDEAALTKKVSYFMGFNLINNLKREGEVDMEQLIEGMHAAANGPDRKSYVIGYQLMSQLKEQGTDMDMDIMIEGMASATEGEKLGMEPEEIKAMMMAFNQLMQKKQMEKKMQESDANIAAGEAYMVKAAAENPNMKKLENGVQYEVLVEGAGPSPLPTDKIKVDYHGTFLDGSVFDSTLKPLDGSDPKAAEFAVGGVVPGFSKTLQSMKVGSKWKVCIPGPVAYGMAGRDNIGPNQALLFEITLLEILK